MEKKLFEFKGHVTDTGEFEGHGAVTGNMDRGGDIIQPGAFKNLDVLVRRGAMPIGHDWGDLGVAMIMDAHEDDKGLFLRAKFHGDGAAQAARQRILERFDAGKTVNLSIGYRTLKASYGTVDGMDVRYLEEIEVYEVSFVLVPMNPEATGTGAKTLSELGDELIASTKQFAERVAKRRDSRLREGKDLSDSQLAKVTELRDSLTAILDAPEPKTEEPEEVSEDDMAQVRRKACALALAPNPN